MKLCLVVAFVACAWASSVSAQDLPPNRKWTVVENVDAMTDEVQRQLTYRDEQWLLTLMCQPETGPTGLEVQGVIINLLLGDGWSGDIELMWRIDQNPAAGPFSLVGGAGFLPLGAEEVGLLFQHLTDGAEDRLLIRVGDVDWQIEEVKNIEKRMAELACEGTIPALVSG